MDSKRLCIDCLELQPVVIELMGEAAETKELLHELVAYLEEHGCECVDGKSGYFIDR